MKIVPDLTGLQITPNPSSEEEENGEHLKEEKESNE